MKQISIALLAFALVTFAESRALAIPQSSVAPIAISGGFEYLAEDATTSEIGEGSNLYFTNARSRSAISSSAPLSYNTSSGDLSCPTASGSQGGCISSSSFSTFNSKFGSITYTASTPSRSLNSNFTPSATNGVFACYSFTGDCTVSVGGSCNWSVELRSDTNSTPTTARGSVGTILNLAVGVAVSTTSGGARQICYLVPPGHNVRLVSSGTATPTISVQSEVALSFGQ